MRKWRRWTAIVAVALMAGAMVGCGDDDDDSGTPNNDDNGPEWEELEDRRGWLEKRDEDMVGEGAFMETDYAWIGDSCDEPLESMEDGPGLAWLEVEAAENLGSNAGSNDGLGSTRIEDRLTARPDLEVEPAPIFNVSLNNPTVRDFEENDNYDRLVKAMETSGNSALLYSECRTVYERGSCYVPSDEMSADGCSMAPENNVSRQHSVGSLEMDGEDGQFEFQVGSLCDDFNEVEGEGDIWEDPELADSLGVQEITLFDVESWEMGQMRELSGEDLEWSSSYNSSRNCQDLRNPGPMCDCVWDFKEVEEFERAWALPMEDRVYVELKGSGDDSEFYFWGTVER